MKKILFASAITLLTFGAFAQGNSGKNKKEKHSESRMENDDRGDYKKDREESKHDERDDRRDDRYDNRNDHRRYDKNSGKYSKNTPRKVGDAFRRDFPNATNVSWTKDQGVWTATFNGGGLFNGNKSVSYRANGERIGQVAGRTGIGSIFNQR